MFRRIPLAAIGSRLIVVTAGFALCASSVSQTSVLRIPEIRAESFAGNAVSLPESLHGQPGILILGFTETSREAVTLWGQRLVNDTSGVPPAMFYEMPVLASVPKLLRGFVLGRVKAAVAEPIRTHFLPVFDHETEWRALARYKAPDDAYVLLIDGSGTVRWQTQGPPTEASWATLRQQVVRLQSTANGGK